MAAVVCTFCHHRAEPFTSCVVVPGWLYDSCANCYYSSKGSYYSFCHSKYPPPLLDLPANLYQVSLAAPWLLPSLFLMPSLGLPWPSHTIASLSHVLVLPL